MAPYGARKKRQFGIQYHGNYCGPGWSARKYQKSVVSHVPAVDAFDRTCKVHDAAYAKGKDLAEADIQFFKDNVGKGVKRTIAGLVVGAQGIVRKIGGGRGSGGVKNPNPNPSPITPRSDPRNLGRSSRENKREILQQSISSSKKMPRSKKVSSKRRIKKYVKRKVKRAVKKYVKRKYRKNLKLKVNGYNGIIVKQEYGNRTSATADRTLYIGHGTCQLHNLRDIFFRCLAKEIILMLGGRVQSLQETLDSAILTPLNFYGAIRINYQNTEHATDVTTLCYFSKADHIDNLAVNMRNEFMNQTADDKVWYPAWVSVQTYRGTSTEAPTDYLDCKTIDLEGANLILNCSSHLKVQNQTKGTTLIGETDTVDRNPLTGKYYTSGVKQMNVPVFRGEGADKFTGADDQNGIFAFNGTDDYAKPVSHKSCGMAKSTTVGVAPGNFLSSRIKYVRRMGVKQFFIKMGNYMSIGNVPAVHTGQQTLAMGSTAMFGLEKFVRSLGTSTDIEIAFQLDNTIGMAVNFKKRKFTTQNVSVLVGA